MANRRFCVFILSHGRPTRVRTRTILEQQGYSGDWYVVVDNEDRTAPEYLRLFGPEHVIVFDKLAVAETFDPADTFPDRRTVVYARNACWQIARELGYDRFLQLDDDYTSLMFRFQERGRLRGRDCSNLDQLFTIMLDFLDDTGATSVALSQGGDHLGGLKSRRWQQKILRKAMNTFFCRTDDTWRFAGKMNEDVNAYTVLSTRGALFFTTMYCMITQVQTQANPGGMTEQYLESGTYVKSFYTVMMCPSAVTIGVMGETHSRIHHHINWRNVAPQILAERYRKPLEVPS